MRSLIRGTSAAFLVLSFTIMGCALLTPAERPVSETRELIFWYPGASSVQVLADWNEWGGTVSAGGIPDPTAGSMTRGDEGYWMLKMPDLDAGVYRYVYLVNGTMYLPDPSVPVTATFMQHTVSVILVSD